MANELAPAGKGQSLQQMMLGKAYSYIQKNAVGPLPCLPRIQKLTQNGLDTKIEDHEL